MSISVDLIFPEGDNVTRHDLLLYRLIVQKYTLYSKTEQWFIIVNYLMTHHSTIVIIVFKDECFLSLRMIWKRINVEAVWSITITLYYRYYCNIVRLYTCDCDIVIAPNLVMNSECMERHFHCLLVKCLLSEM